MNLRPIKNEKDYRNALERLEVIFDAAVDTKEGDEAEILSLMIENYENEQIKKWYQIMGFKRISSDNGCYISFRL